MSGDAPQVDPGEESLFILQDLLCLLREKNILTRGDMENLARKVDQRARDSAAGPMPCCREAALAASADLRRLTEYMGQRYGGKHARPTE